MAFNITTLPFTGLWLPSYAGNPWAPTASAGTSGANGNLSEATNPPAVGAAVNGFTPADYDGTNDELTAAAANADLFSDTAYSIIMLAYLDAFTTADPGAAAAYAMPGFVDLLGNGAPCAGFGGVGAVGVFRAGHYDGAWKSASVAINAGEWVMAAACYDGVSMKVSANAGAQTATAIGAVASLTGNMRSGVDQGGTVFLDGRKLVIATANTDLSASLGNIKSYFNTRFGLSL